jgi:hypothetical protein
MPHVKNRSNSGRGLRQMLWIAVENSPNDAVGLLPQQASGTAAALIQPKRGEPWLSLGDCIIHASR